MYIAHLLCELKCYQFLFFADNIIFERLGSASAALKGITLEHLDVSLCCSYGCKPMLSLWMDVSLCCPYGWM